MTQTPLYLLDADVFITAKNYYYAFDICPGFWEILIDNHNKGRVFSIKPIRKELLDGHQTEDLVKWVKNQLPDAFFLDVDNTKVIEQYSSIILWSQKHPNFNNAARAKFANGADGWLVAYAKVMGYTVVTNEKPAPESKKDIKIPDVCDHFQVEYLNTFQFLRKIGAKLTT
jgi:hypothetical protein